MKRIKYNWLFAIHDLGMDDIFESFKADHDLKCHTENRKPLSIKRLARAFMLWLSDLYTWDILHNPDWIVGHEVSSFE